jgi:hypothetical protein
MPELAELLENALVSHDSDALENYLTAHSNLPGARMNLAVVNAFADAVGNLISQPNPPTEVLENLLDGWAALDTPVNDPRVMLPCAAVLAYGQVGASRPDWWGDEVAKLYRAASDARWRVREMVAMALQRMLAAHWDRTFKVLRVWVADDNPLVIRAAVAGVAEPPIISLPGRGYYALEIQQSAVERFAGFPSDARHSEDVRTLRQALGFTVSVAVAAAPDEGLRLLERLAASGDDDLRWIARENLKKNRLKKWSDRVAAIQGML